MLRTGFRRHTFRINGISNCAGIALTGRLHQNNQTPHRMVFVHTSRGTAGSCLRVVFVLSRTQQFRFSPEKNSNYIRFNSNSVLILGQTYSEPFEPFLWHSSLATHCLVCVSIILPLVHWHEGFSINAKHRILPNESQVRGQTGVTSTNFWSFPSQTNSIRLI